MASETERLRNAIREIEIQANWPIDTPPNAHARMSTILRIIHALDAPHPVRFCVNCAGDLPEGSTNTLCAGCSQWIEAPEKRCAHGNFSADCDACFRESDFAFDAARERR